MMETMRMMMDATTTVRSQPAIPLVRALPLSALLFVVRERARNRRKREKKENLDGDGLAANCSSDEPGFGRITYPPRLSSPLLLIPSAFLLFT